MPKEPFQALQPLLDILEKIDKNGTPRPKSAGRAYARIAEHTGIYPVPNLALEICEQCFIDASKQAMDEKNSETLIRLAGKLAYCSAMPMLSGADNIRDFIACVSYGMSLGIIPGPEATRLLYAAQVAHTAHRKRPKKPGKSPHTATPSIAPTQEKSKTYSPISTPEQRVPPTM